jgi:hypothetical protein
VEAILILILTILFTIWAKISDIGSKQDALEKRFSRLEESFIRLANDFKMKKKV